MVLPLRGPARPDISAQAVPEPILALIGDSRVFIAAQDEWRRQGGATQLRSVIDQAGPCGGLTPTAAAPDDPAALTATNSFALRVTTVAVPEAERAQRIRADARRLVEQCAAAATGSIGR